MRFVVCRYNPEDLVSLHVNTVYKVDITQSLKHNLIAIFDEEGESYIYPKEYFLEIPPNTEIESTLARLYEN